MNWYWNTFSTIMNSFDMSLKISVPVKTFLTIWTFIIPSPFMNSFDMGLKMSILTEWFLTIFTFIISSSFMHSFDMSLEVSLSLKWHVTIWTFIIQTFQMNCIYMLTESSFLTEIFFTNATGLKYNQKSWKIEKIGKSWSSNKEKQRAYSSTA